MVPTDVMMGISGFLLFKDLGISTVFPITQIFVLGKYRFAVVMPLGVKI